MLTITPPTLKPGFAFRPATLDDAPDVLALMQACDIAVVGKADETLDDVLVEWQTPGFNLHHDARVLAAPDGRLVGYGIVMDIMRPVTPEIDIYVHPDYWGDMTEALDAFLLDWAEERARQAINRVPADARVAMQAYAYSQDTYYKTILERAGMQVIRHAFRMVINLDTPTPAPVWPDGITVRAFWADDDQRPVLEAVRGSFQDHWGYVDSPFEEHYQRWTHYWDEDFDPSLWFLAMDGDRIAAICLCRPRRGDDDSLGWVSTLGVTRPHRRKGLGMALLLHAFDDLRKRGKTRVGLGVDASSLTGATRLYEKAGMRVAEHIDLYEKELRPGVDYGTQRVE